MRASWHRPREPSREGVLNGCPLGAGGYQQRCSHGCPAVSARGTGCVRRTSMNPSPALSSRAQPGLGSKALTREGSSEGASPSKDTWGPGLEQAPHTYSL